jgi:hypothetical protein
VRQGLLDDREAERARARSRFAILGMLDEVASRPPAASRATSGASAVPPARATSVFVSYNHEDAATALRIRDALQSSGIDVRIDAVAMRPGEDIRSFITRSVRETDATVCVVSNRSLVSGWVALETVQAFEAERLGTARRFIACYLDDDFFRPEYRLARTREIDDRIAEIDALIPRYASERLDTDDLNGEKSRLYALRNDLGRIIARLRDSLALDVRTDRFEASVERLVASLVEDQARAGQ